MELTDASIAEHRLSATRLRVVAVMPSRHTTWLRVLATILPLGLIPASPASAAQDVPRDLVPSVWEGLWSGMATGWSDLATMFNANRISGLAVGPVIVVTRVPCAPATQDRSAGCEAAVAEVCKRNGFGSGISVDVEDGTVCRGDELIELRRNHAPRCKPKTWATRALCW